MSAGLRARVELLERTVADLLAGRLELQVRRLVVAHDVDERSIVLEVKSGDEDLACITVHEGDDSTMIMPADVELSAGGNIVAALAWRGHREHVELTLGGGMAGEGRAAGHGIAAEASIHVSRERAAMHLIGHTGTRQGAVASAGAYAYEAEAQIGAHDFFGVDHPAPAEVAAHVEVQDDGRQAVALTVHRPDPPDPTVMAAKGLMAAISDHFRGLDLRDDATTFLELAHGVQGPEDAQELLDRFSAVVPTLVGRFVGGAR